MFVKCNLSFYILKLIVIVLLDQQAPTVKELKCQLQKVDRELFLVQGLNQEWKFGELR